MKLWQQEWYREDRYFLKSLYAHYSIHLLDSGLVGIHNVRRNGGCDRHDRCGGLRIFMYKRLLHFFNASQALALDRLTRTWVCVVLQFFVVRIVNRRWVAVVDRNRPIRKAGRCGVKSLHQESSNNSKQSYIMGHSLQTLALLVTGTLGEAPAFLLLSRIHEGLRASPRDETTLLDRLVENGGGSGSRASIVPVRRGGCVLLQRGFESDSKAGAIT